MTTDWNAIGLKCGLEIHQQLEGLKLFCRCPTEIREEEPHLNVTRQLRAVAGEAGAVDVAALKEMQKGRQFVYEGYLDSTCLVELDETPPQAMNQVVLHTALQLSKILNASVVDEVHVMRKTVVDGSNTSGFQRTALISMDGELSTSEGPVRIATLCAEEDACRIITEDADRKVYRLDRLGIPLLEIATEPDIKSPEHCVETAERIGLLIRSTGKAKRGLGTIRQDVNVSVKGGTRIEIKGAQDLNTVSLLVETEANRQLKLIEIKNELTKRNALPVAAAFVDVASLFGKTRAKLIENVVANGGVIMAVKLPRFAGLIGKETQPKKRFGTELSDRAKILAGVGGIFHSDELPHYGMSQEEVDAIIKELECGANDGFVLVAAEKDRAVHALSAVVDRANDAFDGVPKEVRKANPDGTTSYLRPMPGAARMYPETDIPTIPIDAATIDEIDIPELIEERAERYEKLGIGKDMAPLAARNQNWELFEKFMNEFQQLKASYIAEVFFGAAKTIKRQDNIDINPTEDDFFALFHALANEKVSKESVFAILKEKKPVERVLKKYAVISDEALEREIQQIINENKGTPMNALMGIAMGKLRGKASGQKIAELIKKLTS